MVLDCVLLGAGLVAVADGVVSGFVAAAGHGLRLVSGLLLR